MTVSTMDEKNDTHLTDEAESSADSDSQGAEELTAVDKIVGVFVSPITTFRYLARRPDFWTAFIALALLSIALAMVVTPKVLPMAMNVTIDQLQNQPGMSDQDRAKAIEVVRKAIPIATYSQAILGTPIGLAVIWIISVALIFVIALIQGLDTDFKRLLGVYPWIGFISLFSAILQKLPLLTRELTSTQQMQDPRFLMPYSLLGLVPQTVELPRFVAAVLGMIDPFYIWSFVVTVIALEQANRCKRSQAILTTVIFYAISLAVAAGLMAVAAMFQK